MSVTIAAYVVGVGTGATVPCQDSAGMDSHSRTSALRWVADVVLEIAVVGMMGAQLGRDREYLAGML